MIHSLLTHRVLISQLTMSTRTSVPAVSIPTITFTPWVGCSDSAGFSVGESTGPNWERSSADGFTERLCHVHYLERKYAQIKHEATVSLARGYGAQAAEQADKATRYHSEAMAGWHQSAESLVNCSAFMRGHGRREGYND